MADNTASIGFEKQIWDAACVLRGNIDASEYKSVVLGLIFLKYISDRFDEKYQQLVEEGDGFEEDVDEYISEGIFFVPETARWSVIASKAHTPEIGTVIDDAMRAIEKENKRLHARKRHPRRRWKSPQHCHQEGQSGPAADPPSTSPRSSFLRHPKAGGGKH